MTLRQVKVLIADDSTTVHQLIRDSLPGDYSTSVMQAFDGVECLNALDQGIDLAFIDVHMPSMGGMDALWAALPLVRENASATIAANDLVATEPCGN
jgi:CheY-like chemotaxis protein